MILPNLASRPQLNTRPVWILTAAALALALINGSLVLNHHLQSTHDLAEQIAEKENLEDHRAELVAELKEHLDALKTVPWKALGRRISAVNGILGEHRFSWIQLLDDLGETLPWQVRLVQITPAIEDGEISLRLQAVSRDREGFLDFLDALLSDPHFDNPIPSRETWPESGKSVEYVFTLEVDYDPEGGKQ